MAVEGLSEELFMAIHEALGEASMCWENPGGAGVFDSNHAADVGLRLSQTVGAAIARLERERDEARLKLTAAQSEAAGAWAIVLGERGHVNDLNAMYQESVVERDAAVTLQGLLEADELRRAEGRAALDLEAARADAARMRLALEMYGRHSGVCSSVAPRGDGGCDCGYLSALTPDDGWLARHDAEVRDKAIRDAVAESKEECWHCGAPQAEQLARRIEEAVEPYRALIERVATMQKNDWIALSLEARALRGGTPGGDE